MENIQNQYVPTAEEMEQEQIALHMPTEEEVKARVLSEYGFDEELDSEKIDKAVAREMKLAAEHVKLVGQKIKYRDLVNKPKDTPPTKSDVKIDADEVDKIVDTKLKQTLKQRDLDTMEYPDDIKKDIERIAEIAGISVKQAEKDPYIVSKIEQYKKDKSANEAAISRNHKSGGKTDLTNLTEEDVMKLDMGTKEGQEAWEKHKEELRKKYPTP